MIHLLSAAVGAPEAAQADTFPFRVPAIAGLIGQELSLDSEVTFFVGENGSGKSTLLEAVACAAGMIAVGSAGVEQDETLAAVRELAAVVRLRWRKKHRRGFFMRAEDFFGYAKRMRRTLDELEGELRAIETRDDLSEEGRRYSRQPYVREIGELRRLYGEGLDARSHGESFLALFRARLVPSGLYLLDEPEAPLSPLRQLELLAMLRLLVDEQGAQLIIATHSPILMAFPGARIYSFDEGQVRQVAYDDVEHVRVTREFLQAPQRFLRHL